MVDVHAEYPLAKYAERDLLDWYQRTDEITRERGRRWYNRARQVCAEIARDTGYTRAQVAAVLAITSPDAQLSTNIRWTRQACENGGQSAGKYPGDQLPKVRAALADPRRPGQYATGPKVGAFYRAIMGDCDVLVIDRWAAFAAGGVRDQAPRKAAREVFEQAYRSAAAKVGETVRDFQAIVWIASRSETPRANGQRVRLADIV